MKAIETHDYGCKCERCQAIIKAMLTRTPDGEYFFSDEELEEMSLTLHLWRLTKSEFPTPPTLTVGIKEAGILHIEQRRAAK